MTMSFDAEPMSLEELDEFLMSDDAPEDCMLLSDLDGFLTAIAIGPEFIRPSEWLPRVWGEDGPTFGSEAQMQRTLGTILGRYNEILDTLANEPQAFEPILWINEMTGHAIVADWAEGFMEGMSLRSNSWRALLNSADAEFLAPIVVFAVGPEGEPVVSPDDEEQVKKLIENAADLIPHSVAAIYAFFKKTRAFFEGGTKLGRNEPCFCGSGKKFKNCCGAGRH